MSEDFDKLPDVVTDEWLKKFYHDVYRGHLNQLSSFLAMGRLAVMINEARAADRQEITGLRKDVRDLVEKLNETKALWNRDHAKLATYEERQKQGVVEFEEWWPIFSRPLRAEQSPGWSSEDIAWSAWNDARVGWLPANECVLLPALEWPEGMNEYAVSGGFREHSKVERYMSQELRVIKRPTSQPTPAQLRAEMLAKLDAEYQRIEAEMSRIEAMTDAEVLAQKDYHAD